MGLLRQIERDIKAARERDPAAVSGVRVAAVGGDEAAEGAVHVPSVVEGEAGPAPCSAKGICPVKPRSVSGVPVLDPTSPNG